MKNGMSVKVDIQAQIANLKQVSEQLQQALNNGVVEGTASYKKLDKALGRVKDHLIDLTNLNPDGIFTSTGEIDRFQKKFNNTALALKNIASTMQEIDIGDLKLDDNLPEVKKLKQLRQDAEEIERKLRNIENVNFKEFLKSADTELIDKLKNLKIDADTGTFEKALKKLGQEADGLQRKLNDMVGALKAADNAVQKTQNQIDTTNNERKKVVADSMQNSQIISDVMNAPNGGFSMADRVKNRQYTEADISALEGYYYEAFGVTKESTNAVSSFENTMMNSNDDAKKDNAIDNFFNKLLAQLQAKAAAYDKLQKDFDKKLKQLADEMDEKVKKKDALKKEQEDIRKEIDTNTKNTEDVKNAKDNPDNDAREKDLRDNLKATGDEINKTTQEVKNYNESLQKAGEGQREAGASVEELTSKFRTANDELSRQNTLITQASQIRNTITQFFGFANVIQITKRAISSMIKTITELDSAMTEIAVVTDMTQSDLWGQMDAYASLATTYGTTIKGVYEISALFYQQGARKDS